MLPTDRMDAMFQRLALDGIAQLQYSGRAIAAVVALAIALVPALTAAFHYQYIKLRCRLPRLRNSQHRRAGTPAAFQNP
jgi:hypothetical protein